MKVVVTAWNAVVMDSWENGTKFESELLSLMESAPKTAKLEMKRLIKRKKLNSLMIQELLAIFGLERIMESLRLDVKLV